MQLFILRHGDASVPPGGSERSLTPRGELEAEAAGRLLVGENIGQIISSPLLRTRQTTDLVLRSLEDTPVVYADELVPPSTGDAVCAVAERSGAEAVLLVSHMPLVAYLVSWLLAGDYQSYPLVGYPEAGLVALDVPICAAGLASLRWYAFPPEFDKRRH